MCGIAGILHRDRNAVVAMELLEAMTDRMIHRGPDERGFYIDGALGLGHRRLSIIDLATGQQPMRDVRRCKVICFNGEIYNYRALRSSMPESERTTLRTASDTEVLLALADLDDFEWLESLNGMFAFAVWVERSGRLLLARDRLGVKPLYYVDLGTSFLFASEIKPLLAHPGVRRAVNTSKIAEYIAFRSVAGEETLFAGIRQVPPGHVMLFEPPAYTPRLMRYWREGLGTDPSTYADAAAPPHEQFTGLFDSAVEHRLVSDVPVGTFNSGGVDSSLVTAFVRAHKQDALHTFSVGFADPSYDESRYADIVSRRYSTTHHALVVSEDDYVRELANALWHLEQPLNHPHTVQLLLLSKLARQYVTVVLTGEGADEVFGGYPRYNIARIAQLARLMPDAGFRGVAHAMRLFGDRRLHKLADTFSADPSELAIANGRFAPTRDLSRLFPGGIDIHERRRLHAQPYVRFGDAVDQLLYYDQRTYLDGLLARLDKMSMAASIEARVPFLDYRLVEWSYKIDTELKIRGMVNKWVVKKAAEAWLPRAIVHRKKVGFDVPVGQWLRNRKQLGRYVELLGDRSFRERGYFDSTVVRSFVEEHASGKREHTETLWALVNFELWCRMFIDAGDNEFRS